MEVKTLKGDFSIGHEHNPEGVAKVLESLISIIHIEGDLGINNSILSNIDFLSNIKSVGGGIYIFGNESLVSIEGLKNITKVGESVWVHWNNALTNLEGLNKLISIGFNNKPNIGGSLEITNNKYLQNIHALNVNLKVKNNIDIEYKTLIRCIDDLKEGKQSYRVGNEYVALPPKEYTKDDGDLLMELLKGEDK